MRLIAATALAGLLASPLAAREPVCNAPDVMISVLSEGYGERVLLSAVSGDGTLYQVWVNLSAGTWTIVTTVPGAGESCAIDGGSLIPTGEPA